MRSTFNISLSSTARKLKKLFSIHEGQSITMRTIAFTISGCFNALFRRFFTKELRTILAGFIGGPCAAIAIDAITVILFFKLHKIIAIPTTEEDEKLITKRLDAIKAELKSGVIPEKEIDLELFHRKLAHFELDPYQKEPARRKLILDVDDTIYLLRQLKKIQCASKSLQLSISSWQHVNFRMYCWGSHLAQYLDAPSRANATGVCRGWFAISNLPLTGHYVVVSYRHNFAIRLDTCERRPTLAELNAVLIKNKPLFFSVSSKEKIAITKRLERVVKSSVFQIAKPLMQ